MAYNYSQPSAPSAPMDQYRPPPPVRSEFATDPQQQGLLSERPRVPERMDKPPRTAVRSSGVNILQHIAYITTISYPIIHST